MLFGPQLDGRGAWTVPDTRHPGERRISAARGSSQTYGASRGTPWAAEHPLACH